MQTSQRHIDVCIVVGFVFSITLQFYFSQFRKISQDLQELCIINNGCEQEKVAEGQCLLQQEEEEGCTCQQVPTASYHAASQVESQNKE
jgi:hypothetical protein